MCHPVDLKIHSLTHISQFSSIHYNFLLHIFINSLDYIPQLRNLIRSSSRRKLTQVPFHRGVFSPSYQRASTSAFIYTSTGGLSDPLEYVLVRIKSPLKINKCISYVDRMVVVMVIGTHLSMNVIPEWNGMDITMCCYRR